MLPAPLKRRLPRHLVALTALACSQGISLAQDSPQRVEPITVTARSAPVLEAEDAQVSGFNAPLAKTPQSIAVIGSDLLAATGVRTLSSALKLDASLADNYNAAGYVENLTVRGFALDQTNNFRRNGLANSNYAPIALENKERIEILKGTAGLHAGVAAPGGLVNFVTKQPLRDAFTAVTLDVDRWSRTRVHLDANTRIGIAGMRINLAGERLDSQFDRAGGRRALASAAFVLPLSSKTSLSFDLEHHHQRQPSVPGLGLLDRNDDGYAESLPDARRLWRVNLNDQAWSLPVVSRTTQATAKLEHALSANWKASLGIHHFATKLDDRIAFPDGCGSAANYVYPGFCGNGDVDVYDFRNDGERRTLTSFDATLRGKVKAFTRDHSISASLSGRDGAVRQPRAGAYNYAGTTNVFAPIRLPANAALDSVNTNSDERALEAAASIHSKWNGLVETFAGVRITRAKRTSVRTDGSEGVALTQTLATPWFASVLNLTTTHALYAQYSQGAETESVPNRSDRFTNFGAQLTGAKSDQVELGWKWQVTRRLLATAAGFSIEKPYADDRFDPLDEEGRATRVANGKLARHRGVELSLVGRVSETLSLQASATYLDARYVRALNENIVNQRVTNAPRFAASVFADYKIAAVPGLSINGLLYLQQGKTVDPLGQIALPRAAQLDLGASYQTRVAHRVITTRLNIENVTNRAYWREAPTTSWGGSYLFASAPRNVRLSATLDF